jgi:nitrogen-specific signal transduction histidine kinase
VSDAVSRPSALRAAAPDAERWLEALPAPVLGVDSGERIRFVNAAAADLLAGVGRGLLGRRLEDVFGADAPLLALARRTLVAGADIAEAASLSPPLRWGRTATSPWC